MMGIHDIHILHTKFLRRDTDLGSQSKQEIDYKHAIRTRGVGLIECFMLLGTHSIIHPAHIREVLI